ncbi:MAG: dTDP-4-amino-4,6-dideoxygalactose transaminase [Sedimentisphaerales bacterium]|nr:dTDP-4-amino-4,6-dideoxygalactose transaminase [Sedimentisphaerales bacterium]
MIAYSIPFNRAGLQGSELEYIADAIRRGHIAGDGHYAQKCHALLRETLGIPAAFLTTSGTSALEMAALLLELRDGDEVIIPSFTFVSTANAFCRFGARPVFVDIRPDTLNLNEELLEANCSERTRAIVPVHYGGIGCAMERIMALAEQRGLAVVEDNAHGLFGRYRDRWLGSFGQLAALSFHETKNFTCGEGGALLIRDAAFIERAEILREKGTDRSRLFRGEIDKYSWIDTGSSYLPSEILAAFLWAQLENRDRVQQRRQQIWELYHERLGDWAGRHGVRLAEIPADCQSSYHLFYLLLPDGRQRDRLIEHLRRRGIYAVFHYLPLHRSPMARRLTGRSWDCPVTEQVSDRLVRLPFYGGLRPEEQDYIIRTVQGFYDA